MARTMTPNPFAEVSVYIADGADGSAEAVEFGSAGQNVRIVPSRDEADTVIRVKRGGKFLPQDQAQRLAIGGAYGEALPDERKRHGRTFKYSVFGSVLWFALGIFALGSGEAVGGILVMLSTPIFGPIAGMIIRGFAYVLRT